MDHILASEFPAKFLNEVVADLAVRRIAKRAGMKLSEIEASRIIDRVLTGCRDTEFDPPAIFALTEDVMETMRAFDELSG